MAGAEGLEPTTLGFGEPASLAQNVNSDKNFGKLNRISCRPTDDGVAKAAQKQPLLEILSLPTTHKFPAKSGNVQADGGINGVASPVKQQGKEQQKFLHKHNPQIPSVSNGETKITK